MVYEQPIDKSKTKRHVQQQEQQNDTRHLFVGEVDLPERA